MVRGQDKLQMDDGKKTKEPCRSSLGFLSFFASAAIVFTTEMLYVYKFTYSSQREIEDALH